MKRTQVKKVMIIGTRLDVDGQLLGKARELFGTGAGAPKYIVAGPDSAASAADCVAGLAEAIRAEEPELILIGATVLGEEIAPALGVQLGTGVAAHCTDIRINEDGRIAFLVPAFGGKVIGEIFVPGACSEHPAIATVKPGTFQNQSEQNQTDAAEQNQGSAAESGRAEPAARAEVDELNDCMENGRTEPAGQEVPTRGGFRVKSVRRLDSQVGNLAEAEVVLCGGFGLGGAEYSEKLRLLAERLGAGCGCTRAALDMDWGFREGTMIGTSGINVKPKVYVGFGISGAAHHTCGIKDADVIISINNDKNAEVFGASDYIGTFDAHAVIDELLRLTEE